MERIAIVGSGISGLVCAYLLSQKYEVTLIEQNESLGGHTNTVTVDRGNQSYQIDTGFIVFNHKTYPQFTSLLRKLNIPIQSTEMSFSYRSDRKNLEYSTQNLNTLFIDRKNLRKQQHYRFLFDILKFNHDAKKFLAQKNLKIKSSVMTIGDFIREHHYSTCFIEAYIVPMMAAIWSKNTEDTLNCSAYFILNFYQQHGLLNTVFRPQWLVIKSGSSTYIPKLIKDIKKIFLNTKICSIIRKPGSVSIKSSQEEFYFDKVVIATHSDQALNMLENPTPEEQVILSAIPYTTNQITLHTDTSVLPKNPKAWASWNYFDTDSPKASLTYYMNKLQKIKSADHFCVSVNLDAHIAPEKIIKKITYAHPCFNQHSLQAQDQFNLINSKENKNNTYFAGAYWGNGFHEDGVVSALKVCSALGVIL